MWGSLNTFGKKSFPRSFAIKSNETSIVAEQFYFRVFFYTETKFNR